MTETITSVYLDHRVSRVCGPWSLDVLVVTVVINMRWLDVNMRMSMKTFATHEETIKFNYFYYKRVLLWSEIILCDGWMDME